MSAKTQINLNKIIEMVIRNNHAKFKTVGIWCMVGGIPNVGKSTLINAFRTASQNIKELSEDTKKYAKTGIHPTTTRHIDSFKVNLEPLIYIMDTPGIMPPKIDNPESGLKLSLCGNIKDVIVGKELICDYLLYSLNKLSHKDYVKAFKLDDPIDDIYTVTNHIKKQFNITTNNNAHDFIIRYYKEGKLGKMTFEENIIKDVIIK